MGCMVVQHIEHLCGLEYVRDWTRELRPQTHIGRSLIQNCVRILQAHTYIAIWCVITVDNKTHIHYDCILHTKQRLYCQ